MIEKIVTEQLINLFQEYILAFKCYDLSAVKQCYQLPCTLHTPDKIAYLANDASFEQEFIDIFTVLKHANIKNIVVNKASYSASGEHSLVVCIDWLFLTAENENFAEFSAFYHLELIKNEYKIVSVVSHDLTNSVELDKHFTLADINV